MRRTLTLPDWPLIDGSQPLLFDSCVLASSTVPTNTWSTFCSRPMATAFSPSRSSTLIEPSAASMRGISAVECVTSDAIVRPTSAPTLRLPDAVASAKGKMPTLIARSPAAGDAGVCPAATLANPSMSRRSDALIFLTPQSRWIPSAAMRQTQP
jgi:hypothetical protein